MKENLLVFIKAISDSNRLKILNYLKKECCVGDLWDTLKLPQNLVSHHLKVLKEAKLITANKQGLKVIYCLNIEIMNKNLEDLNNYLK